MATRDFRSRLLKRAAKAGIFMDDELASRLTAYYELLERWNKKINLTALTDPDDAIDRLLLEPVVAARYIPSPRARLMDVGSGGGSPAIPMKLVSPSIFLTMVEVKARKSAFLREAVRHLGLDFTVVENSRYEELLTRPELHEGLDAVSMRAVRVESKTLLSLQAFLKPGGVMLLFRGQSGPDEPSAFVAPLSYAATHPLVETTRSRLTLLSKRSLGGPIVPRGTN